MTTNTVFQLRRNAVSGTRPTTTTVAQGELAINTTDGILFSANSTAIFEIGANVTSIAIGNSTTRQTANSTGMYANGSVNLTRNDTRLTFAPVAGGANVYIVQQNDDNFVFYTTNTTNNPRPVFSVFANTNPTNQNSSFTFRGPVDFSSSGVYANNSLGTAGQVLTTNGSGVYWSGISASVNAAAQFAWTNTHTFAANLTILGTSELIIANGAGIQANGSFGSTGQVLSSNGTGVYWFTVPSATSVRQTFTANSTVNTTFTVTGGYTVGFVDVYKNGVKLINGTDVTVSSGSTVVLATPAVTGEVVDVVGALTGSLVGVTTDGAQTLTNKRIDPRVSSTASAASVTPDISSFDMYIFTALATGLTINATTGGAPVNGSKMVFRFKDNGTARTLTWTTAGSNSFRAVGVTLPTTTVINKVTYVGCIYNADEAFWDVIAAVTQA